MDTHRIFERADTANTWSLKVEYILKNPIQRTKYKALKKDQDKIDFFLNHFVMNDLASRQLSFTLSNDDEERENFIECVDRLILLMESETNLAKHQLA